MAKAVTITVDGKKYIRSTSRSGQYAVDTRSAHNGATKAALARKEKQRTAYKAKKEKPFKGHEFGQKI